MTTTDQQGQPQPKPDDKADQIRADAALKRMLSTPPKPRKAKPARKS